MTDTITLSRSVVEQALSTLEGWDNYDKWVWPESALSTAKKNTAEMISALRAALEQPQDHSERRLDMVPKGWKLVPVEPTIPMLYRADGLTCIDFVALGEEGAFDLDELKEIYRAMLAAAPQPPTTEQSSAVQPPRQPLTDEQMRDALRQCPHDAVENLRVRWLYAKDFARAIERAHGIGGEE